MFENFRVKLAQSIMPKTREVNLSSFAMPGQPIYTEMSVRKATREGYKLSLYVYRAVRTIVEAGSGIPWVVLDKNGERIPNHPFELVMQRPNPYQSGQDMMEFMIAHRKLCGNALWMPLTARGQIKEIWMVMPDLVSPIPSLNPGEWLSGWQVTEPAGKTQIMPPETFIHFMQFDPGNPYWGIGDLQAAARTVDTDNEAQDTQKVSMQNRGIPSGVFQHSEMLSSEQFEEQNRRVREIFLQKSKRREPWVLGAGATWQPMSFTPVELDFMMSRRDAKRDIFGAFNVDPWFGGDRENSTYNNVAEARKGLYENNIIPMLDDIKSTLNLVVAPLYGDVTITYDLSNIAALREDFGKKVTQAQALWAMGVPFDQINHKLELGFEEFEGWDTGYLPFSVMPVGEPEPVKPEPVKKKSKRPTNLQRFILTQFARQRTQLINNFTPVVETTLNKLGTQISDIYLRQTKSDADLERLIQSIMRELGIDKWAATNLLPKYQAQYKLVLESTFDTVKVALELGLNLPDRVMRRILELGGKRVGLLDLEKNTKDKLFETITQARSEGLGTDQVASLIRDKIPAGPWKDSATRAKVISLTETKYAQNMSAIESYKLSDAVTGMQAMDNLIGFDDEDCIARDGRVFDFDEVEAETEAEHPNGTLTWAPYTGEL